MVRHGALAILDETGERRPAIEGPIVQIAAVGDELWVVADHALHRLDRTGARRGAAVRLPGAGRLVAAARGLLATWNAAEPRVLRGVGSEVVDEPIEACDLAIVSDGGRIAIARGATLELPVRGGRRSVQLPAGHRAIDGTVLADSGALCVVAERTPGHGTAIVVGPDGGLRLRLAIVGARNIRLAPARGLLAVQTDAERISIVDLRFGKIVQEVEHTAPIDDFAIDRAGYALALVDCAGELVVLAERDRRLAPLYGSSVERPAPPHAVASAPPIALDEVAAPDEAYVDEVPAPNVDDPGPSLAESAPALPRLQRRTRDRDCDVTTVVAAWHNELVARARLAIARAWDHGRLGFSHDDRWPAHSEVSAIVTPSAGRAPEELAAALALVTTTAAARDACERATGVDPLAELTQELALGELEREVLIAVAAPQLWPDVARLYAILACRAGGTPCNDSLLVELLRDRATADDIARVCAADGPLSSPGILESATAGLAVAPVVLQRLRGLRIARLADAAIAVHDDEGPLDDLVLSRETRTQLRAILDGATPLRLAVRGRTGSGRRTLLARLAASTGRRLGLVDAAAYIHGAAPRLAALGTALQHAQLAGWLPCLDGLAIAPDDPQLRAQLASLLRDHAGPLCFRMPSDADPLGAPVVDLPPPSFAMRSALWRRALAQAGRTDDPDDLATRWAIGPGTIHRAVARARDDLGDAVRALLDARIGSRAMRVRHLARWEDVVLPPELVDSMAELVARVRHRDQVLERWGLSRISTTGRGVVALFQGAPGTGKTLVAGAIARELGLELYRVDLARVVSKWIGETERNLGELFDAAEDGNSILLFDEADSLFARRTEVRTSVDRYANLEVNYLLQRLDTFTGVAILTSNFGTAIDEAFMRRMSFRVSFPFPDEEMREHLWRVHLPASVPRAGSFDLSALAKRHALAGGYIRNVALRATFLAAGEGSPLRQAHLERAIHLEYRELGRLTSARREGKPSDT